MARGSGVSHASGLAGVTNGDVLRQGTADLGNGPYVARAFLRFIVPMGSGYNARLLPARRSVALAYPVRLATLYESNKFEVRDPQ